MPTSSPSHNHYGVPIIPPDLGMGIRSSQSDLSMPTGPQGPGKSPDISHLGQLGTPLNKIRHEIPTLGQNFGTSKKRRRENGPDDDERATKVSKPSRKPRSEAATIDRRPSTLPIVRFACPFGLRTPWKYPGCFIKLITTMNNLRTHLLRDHKQPAFCPKCGETFEDENTADEESAEHIRLCESRVDPTPKPEGVTKKMLKEITAHTKKQALQDDTKKWETTFQTIFENEPLPLHYPFIGPPQVQFPLMAFGEWSQQEEFVDVVQHVLTLPNAKQTNIRDLARILRNIQYDKFRTWLKRASGTTEEDTDYDQRLLRPYQPSRASSQHPDEPGQIPCITESGVTWPVEPYTFSHTGVGPSTQPRIPHFPSLQPPRSADDIAAWIPDPNIEVEQNYTADYEDDL